jgi:outer membrane protein assembly factor BamB
MAIPFGHLKTNYIQMKKLMLSLFVLTLIAACSHQPEIAQWRGPERDGRYPGNRLMKQWPAEGPALQWASDAIGDGYGSPVVTHDALFITGAIDSTGYLYSFDLKGNLLWKVVYGPEWATNFPGSRSAPTVVDDLVYVAAGKGDITCFSRKDGSKIWSTNMFSGLHGKNTQFGYSESLLVKDQMVYCTPGGADTNVVALDRFTGKMIWKCKGMGQISAFCSPKIIQHNKHNILLTFSQLAMMGIDADNGKLLFTHKQDTIANVHTNTPIYDNGYLYYVAGDGNRTVKLKLSDDGEGITEVWRCKQFDNMMGGVVQLGNRMIATGHRKLELMSLDMGSGQVTQQLKIGRGATIYADDMIYMYDERGIVHLVDPTGADLKEVCTFKVTKGSKEHLAHPVIANGTLYIRHGNSLMAYNIKQK